MFLKSYNVIVIFLILFLYSTPTFANFQYWTLTSGFNFQSLELDTTPQLSATDIVNDSNKNIKSIFKYDKRVK